MAGTCSAAKGATDGFCGSLSGYGNLTDMPLRIAAIIVHFRTPHDTAQAAKQFIELTTVGLFKPRIFGSMEEVPSTAMIEKNVTSAIRVFLAAYGAKS